DPRSDVDGLDSHLFRRIAGGRPRDHASEPFLCVLPRDQRTARPYRAAGGARRESDRVAQHRLRQKFARLRHAVLDRGGSADRERQVRNEIPPPDDRAGYRRRDRRSRARGSLFRRRVEGGHAGGPHQESWALLYSGAEERRSVEADRSGASAAAKARDREGRAQGRFKKGRFKRRAEEERAETEGKHQSEQDMTTGTGGEEDDRALWDAVKKTVVPLRKSRASRDSKIEKPERHPKPPAKHRRHAHAAPAQPAPRTPAMPPLAKLDRRTRSRVARGSTGIEGRLDLHGYKLAEAKERL